MRFRVRSYPGGKGRVIELNDCVPKKEIPLDVASTTFEGDLGGGRSANCNRPKTCSNKSAAYYTPVCATIAIIIALFLDVFAGGAVCLYS